MYKVNHMKKLQDFYEEALKSDDLKKEFMNCKKDEDLISFLKKYDCDAKVDELKSFLEEKFAKEGKVDAEEIEKISGGKQGGCAIALDTVITVLTVGTVCAALTWNSATRKGKKVGGDLREADSVYCHAK